MQQTIWKFPIRPADLLGIDMPKGAKILTVQVQNDVPCIWVLVDASVKETERKTIVTYGTGGPAPQADYKTYIGTYQLDGFVWHVFELTC